MILWTILNWKYLFYLSIREQDITQTEVGRQLIDRFDKLSMNSKQNIADKVIDEYFSGENWKLKTGDNDQEDSGNEFTRTEFKVGDVYTHTPPIVREKYQMSIWRVNAHSVFKVKYCYFTPSSKRFSSTDFSEFEMSMGWDGTTIMLAESGPRVLQKLFIVFDIDSFELLNEQTINLIDEEVKVDIGKSSNQMTSSNVSLSYWCLTMLILLFFYLKFSIIFRTSILEILKYYIWPRLNHCKLSIGIMAGKFFSIDL